jgi:hypothetical protein
MKAKVKFSKIIENEKIDHNFISNFQIVLSVFFSLDTPIYVFQ